MAKSPLSPTSATPEFHGGGPAGNGESILLCGFSASLADRLRSRLGPSISLLQVATPEEALAALRQRPVGVLCLGDPWHGLVAVDLLRAADALDTPQPRLHLVLSAGETPEVFQGLIDEDRLYYLSPQPPPEIDIARILASALRHRQAMGLETAKEAEAPDTPRRVLEATQGLAHAGLDELPVVACQALEQLLDVERGECLLYDRPSDTLWMPSAGLAEDRRESAAAGVVSFVVRTATAVRLDAVGDDPRYDADADNDGGDPAQRFLAVPVVSSSAEASVLGVLVALRAATAPAFTAADEALIQRLAEQLAPALDRCLLQARVETQEAARDVPDDGAPFRQEALEHYAQDLGDQGHLLELSPRWTRWTYPLLLALVAAALIFSAVASVHEYADGEALVRVEGRDDITAPLAGTVSSIDVEPNQEVAAGDLLVRLYGAQEAAELERLEREFELGLLNRLRNPSDPNIERALGALQARKRLAEARLEERSVRAPRSGVVSDVRVRPGQLLSPGEVILSLHGGDQQLSIVAVFPGHYRPLIRRGMPMRLELEGYRYAYQQLRVDGITDEVFGPLEARRLLGPGGDAIALTGPVVLVYARLPTATFVSDGRTYRYHDGITGRAEIRVRSERLLTTLVPVLENVLPSTAL